MEDQALRYWIGFNRFNGIGAVRLNALLTHFDDLEAAWHAPESVLQQVLNDRRACASVIKMRQTIDLDADLITLRRIGARAITLRDDEYPTLLRHIDAPPPVLFVRGTLQASDERAVAIVGTRDATLYGVKVARGLSHALVKAGWTVISGLAKGIDAAAHSTAIRYGGRTIALLGHGIDRIYPPEHEVLATQITKQGALISEYPLGTPPDGKNFPARNRLISGLSRGVVVVEATLRSGALSTAKHALDQGREAFAVPGPIQSPESAGTHWLIQNGQAKLIASFNDLLAEFEPGLLVAPPVELSADQRKPPKRRTPRTAKTAALTPVTPLPTAAPTLTAADLSEVEGLDEQTIGLWSHLRTQPLRIDDLCLISALPVATVTTALTLLELRGLIRQNSGLIYAISELE